jgi:hypothetical protein
MNSCRRNRKSALSTSLTKTLNLYALSAGTAGVGLLALAIPSEAKVVFTPANQELSLHVMYRIDLNHDGQNDVNFYHWGIGSSAGSNSGLRLANSYVPASNGVVAWKPLRAAYSAVAIPNGVPVGPQEPFRGFASLAIAINSFGHPMRWYGQWANGGKGLQNHYAGVRFVINHEIHYGWLRVSVTTSATQFTAVLTGYAYETVPNKPILAGQIHDDADTVSSLAAPAPEPAMLGLLALGSPGLSIWRREELQ